MARLIDGDALIAWIKGSQQMTSKMKSIICYIKTMPTVDAVEVVRCGENLCKEYPTLFECSLCGASCDDTVSWDCDINFCPNCGASMREREGE